MGQVVFDEFQILYVGTKDWLNDSYEETHCGSLRATKRHKHSSVLHSGKGRS